MSRTKPTERQAQELDVECLDCGAAPNQWCTTKTGRWSTTLHASRFYLIQWREERDHEAVDALATVFAKFEDLG